MNFTGKFEKNVEKDLVLLGGIEMPAIVACILEKYGSGFKDNVTMDEVVQYVTAQNPAGYDFFDIEGVYRYKIESLLEENLI